MLGLVEASPRQDRCIRDFTHAVRLGLMVALALDAGTRSRLQ